MTNEPKHARNDEIYKLWKAGAGYSEIGKRFGVSSSRVAQLCNLYVPNRMKREAKEKTEAKSPGAWTSLINRMEMEAKEKTEIESPSMVKKPSPVLSTLVDEAELSVRVDNALKYRNIHDLKELTKFTEKEIRGWPNLGRRSVNEIKEVLAQRGLSLRVDPPHESNRDRVGYVPYGVDIRLKALERRYDELAMLAKKLESKLEQVQQGHITGLSKAVETVVRNGQFDLRWHDVHG